MVRNQHITQWLHILTLLLSWFVDPWFSGCVSRVLCMAYCWVTRGIVLGLWRAKGGKSGMVGGEGG